MKTIFVNNYHFDDEYENEIRNEIFECGDYQSINDISMDMIYNRMSEYDEDDLIYFKHEFNRLHKTYLLAGHVGTWRGNMKGGMIINSFDDICDFLNDCMYYKIYEENGHVYVQGSHHDGDNFAELFEITKKERSIWIGIIMICTIMRYIIKY